MSESTIDRLGVVAVVPFWSQAANLNADSNYSFLRIVLPEMERQSTDTLFLVFFPDPTYGAGSWTFTPDGLESDRIKFIRWPYDTQMATGVVSFDMMRWKQIEDDHGPTLYWLNQPEMGPTIHRGYYRSYNYSGQPAIVAQHHYIIHKSLPYPIESQFPRLWAQMGGSLAANAVVYNSDHCHVMAQETFGDYLSEERMNALEEKSTVLRFGLITGDEPEAPEATDEEPVFLYNHRFEAYKQPEVTFDVLREMKERYPIKIWVTQTAGQKTGGSRQFIYDEAVFEPSRADYLKRIAVPGVNTMNSTHETFCISILDSMMVGQLVVVPDSLTFPELVPEGYPYLFKTVNEQRAMIATILETWPTEYNKWRQPLIDHARKEFGLSGYARRYLELFQAQEATHRAGTPKDKTTRALHGVFGAMDIGKHYTPAELKRAYCRLLGVGGSQSMPPRRIVREAMTMRNDVTVEWKNGVKLRRF